MQNLIPALRVKDITIFDLLAQEFHWGEFVFFPKLAAYLGQLAGVSEKDAQEIGRISELVYLYAKIHTSVKEGTLEDAGFRGDVQMPVLLGDLFLGRFYRTLAECRKEMILPVYLDFMKELNSTKVDNLDGDTKTGTDEGWLMLLAGKTAEALEMLSGASQQSGESLQAAAKQYLHDEWPVLYGKPIRSLDEFERELERFQGREQC